MKFLKTILLIPALVAGFAAPAIAQTTFAVMNEERVLRESAVGQHIATRLSTIAQEVDAELTALGQPIQQQTEALSAETAIMTQEQIQQRPDLVQRIQTLNQQAQQFEVARRVRQQELVATERQAMRPVYEALGPILEEVVEQRGIDILIDRSELVFAAPEMDISDSIIAILNERLPTVAVNRVRMPQGDAAAAAGEQ